MTSCGRLGGEGAAASPTRGPGGAGTPPEKFPGVLGERELSREINRGGPSIVLPLRWGSIALPGPGGAGVVLRNYPRSLNSASPKMGNERASGPAGKGPGVDFLCVFLQLKGLKPSPHRGAAVV